MALDPRTPVLIGAAAVSQRFDDSRAGTSFLGLMQQASLDAAADSGGTDVLARVGQVLVPKGTWTHRNAAAAIAQKFSPGASSLVADVGILQTTLAARAVASIARGELDMALITGAEAKWRALRAAIEGVELPEEDDDAFADPDEHLAPHGEIISRDEVAAGLVNAVSQYALIENARRRALGLDVTEHRRAIAQLWHGFNEVAVANPAAWNRRPMSVDELMTTSPSNRMLAFPYNKWDNSQWNVDQAAAFLICSVEEARRCRVPEDRWLFPHAIVESNHMVPVSQRDEIHRNRGFAIASQRAFEASSSSPETVDEVDLYSCFPVAVATQVDEIGLDASRPLTVTGGMTFSGGPLNNYVLQSTVAMANRLREHPGTTGLVTAISGIITKQGVSIWSTDPPASGVRVEDVSAEVEAASARRVTTPTPTGQGRVVTYTVVPTTGTGGRVVVVAETGDGARAVTSSQNEDLVATALHEELLDRTVAFGDDGSFTLL